MEVYFVNSDQLGKYIIHKFGCSQLNFNTGEIVGLFLHPLAALNEAQEKYHSVMLCSQCCSDGNKQNQDLI